MDPFTQIMVLLGVNAFLGLVDLMLLMVLLGKLSK